MIVADTNLIVGLTAKDPMSVAVHAKDEDWVAPQIWQSEMRSALLGLMRAGRITNNTAVEMFQVATRTVQTFESSTPAVLRLAEAHGLTAYDAEFAALAEWLQISAVSFDDDLLSQGLAIHPKNF